MPEPTPTPDTRRHAWHFLGGLLGLLLLIDGLLAGITPSTRPSLETRAGVRSTLDAAVRAEPRSWLLLGDSVLVGDTGRAEQPGWDEERLIDYLRRETALEEQVRFEQVALHGLLPVDMLRVVEELDRHDIDARVGLLVELSPRFFSASHAEQTDTSRAWIADLGAAPSLAAGMSSSLDRLREITPVYRHRELFATTRDRLAPDAFASDLAMAPADGGDRLQALARLRVHYRDPRFEAGAAQADAVRRIVELCRARGRPLVFFATPIEDRFHAELLDERQQGAYLAGLSELIRPDGDAVRLLPLDHPLFDTSMFWDHVHLRPEGHRLLAINLLHQMEFGLRRTPHEQELIDRPSLDTSLVARIELGYADGAHWQARFSAARGVAVAAEGQRVVVADGGNHVLRELGGDLRIVRTVAGEPGTPGHIDGKSARLDRPAAPVIEGDQVFFIDGGGTRVRVLEAEAVRTLFELDPSWRATKLRISVGGLFILEVGDGRSRIRRCELDGSGVHTLVEARAGEDIVAFDVSEASMLWLGTSAGRILRARLGVGTPQLELVHANLGNELLPQGEGERFPFAMDRIRLHEIDDLIWVERYEGLLVVDLAPHPGAARSRPVTERAHLRFLDLERGLVYPWVKPLVDGLGNHSYNAESEGFSSYFHEGSLALHQASATSFWLEHGRSRLLRLEDGLLGVAKLGNLDTKSRLGFRDPITSATGERAFADHRPDRFLADRPFGPAWRATYTCLFVSSSLLAIAESSGQHSVVRRLADRLGFELAVRDRIAFETFHRSVRGGSLARQIDQVSNFISAGGRPDVIVIEANPVDFIERDASDEQLVGRLEELELQRAKWDSHLIIVDSSPFRAPGRDPLRARGPKLGHFLALASARGIPIIEVGDAMLEKSLSVTPIGSPPFDGTHLSPWAVDALGDRLAFALAPILRASLREREPASSRRGESERRSAGKTLAAALGDESRARIVDLPALPAAAVQSSLARGHLDILIDVGQLSVSDQPAIDLALVALHELVVRQANGARSATIRLLRFDQYDEYGAGVAEGATTIASFEFDHESLRTQVAAWMAD